MKKYAYLRKGYPAAIKIQLDSLNEYGYNEIVIEEEDFQIDKELQLLIKRLKPDDIVVIYDFAVFAKIGSSFRVLLDIFASRKINLISIQDNVNTKDPADFYKHVEIVFAMTEKHHSFLAKQRLLISKERGITLGRPTIDKAVIQKIVTLSSKEERSMREIAEICNVSLGTVHKYLTSQKKIKV